MKNRLLITLIVFYCMLSIPLKSQAASMAIGYDVWFNWWEMSMEYMEDFYDKYEYTIEPSFLYGPMISFQITPQWSVSSLFIMGSYKAKFTGYYSGDSYKTSYDLWRYDSDTTVSYAFKSFFRLYLGFKYFRYTSDSEFHDSYGFDKGHVETNNYAPGAGVIFVVPLVKNFYLSMTLGLFYSFEETYYKSESTDYAAGETYTYTSYQNYMNHVVVNSKLAFSYDIQKIHMILSLGFRYQVFFYFTTDYKTIEYADIITHLYGIDFSVTFYFDL